MAKLTITVPGGDKVIAQISSDFDEWFGDVLTGIHSSFDLSVICHVEEEEEVKVEVDGVVFHLES